MGVDVDVVEELIAFSNKDHPLTRGEVGSAAEMAVEVAPQVVHAAPATTPRRTMDVEAARLAVFARSGQRIEVNDPLFAIVDINAAVIQSNFEEQAAAFGVIAHQIEGIHDRVNDGIKSADKINSTLNAAASDLQRSSVDLNVAAESLTLAATESISNHAAEVCRSIKTSAAEYANAEKIVIKAQAKEEFELGKSAVQRTVRDAITVPMKTVIAQAETINNNVIIKFDAQTEALGNAVKEHTGALEAAAIAAEQRVNKLLARYIWWVIGFSSVVAISLIVIGFKLFIPTAQKLTSAQEKSIGIGDAVFANWNNLSENEKIRFNSALLAPAPR